MADSLNNTNTSKYVLNSKYTGDNVWRVGVVFYTSMILVKEVRTVTELIGAEGLILYDAMILVHQYILKYSCTLPAQW